MVALTFDLACQPIGYHRRCVPPQMRDLSVFALALGFSVEEYAANKGAIPPRKRRKRCLYVATIEKASSLVNSLVETSRLDGVGIVVVDEVTRCPVMPSYCISYLSIYLK